MKNKKVIVTGSNNNVFVANENSLFVINANEITKDVLALLDPKQAKIFEGLGLIGDEISTFYLHGVEIYKNISLSTKGYLLAHFAREIDGSLKDIFFVREEKIKCSVCGVEQQDENEPLIGIFKFLNIEKESDFAQEWVKIAKNLLEHSKRQGAYSQHRKPEEAQQLWDAYEGILYTLVGNHFALTERVKNLLQNQIPTLEMLNTLPNLFKNDKLKFVFYVNLKSLYWLKPLYDNNFFEITNLLSEYATPKKEGYVTIPAWYEGRYIEFVSIENAKNFDEQISDCLIKVVDGFIESKAKIGILNRNADSSISTTILYLPADKITDKHIEFVFYVIQNDTSYFSHKLIEEGFSNFIRQKATNIILKVLKLMFTLKKQEKDSYPDYRLPIYEYWLFRKFKEIIPELAQLSGIEAVFLFENIFLSFNKQEQNMFSTFYVENVDFSDKDPYTKKSLYALVNTTTQFLLCTNENLENIIERWLNGKVFILRRIALYVISKKYDQYRNVFWAKKQNLFNQYELNIEIAQLIRTNWREFSDKEIKKMVKWIEQIKKTSSFSNESEEERIKYNAYEIRRRLLLLKETNNELVLQKIAEYEEIENSPVKADESFKPLKVSITRGIAHPKSAENIEEKTIDELVEYVKNFDEQDKWERKINYEGLGEALKSLFLQKPDKYFPHISRFQNLDAVLVYQIASVVSKLVESGKFKYWNEFLEFYKKAISTEQLWQHPWVNTVVNTFGWLIKHNVRRDDDRIPMTILPAIKNILLLLLKKVDKQNRTYDDLPMMVSNNPQCVILASLLECEVQMSITQFENEDVKWEEDIKKLFTNILKETPSVQLYAVIGVYLPQLNYLDKAWVKGNVDLILPENNEYWEACFSMYLIYQNQVYFGLYNLLKEKGHYKKALNSDNLKSEVRKRLIGHICLEFDESPQNLDDEDSLMRFLLEQQNVNNLTEVIDTFWKWGHKSKQDETCVKKLWKRLLQICQKNIEQDDFKKLAGRLCHWIPLLEKIGNKSFERIKFSLVHIESTMFLFEDLLCHIEKTPKKVGDLLLEYAKFQSSSTWQYTPDELKSITEYLYENDHKDLANTICDVFGKLGYELGDIYAKFNNFQ